MAQKSLLPALAVAAALAACGEPKKADAAADDEGWVELSEEDGAALAREALAALDAPTDARPGAEIAAAIDAYRNGAAASAYFNAAGFPYRPSEYGQITNLPGNAAADGITGAAGYVLDAADGPFKSVLVSYLVFDDPANAAAFRDKLDRNFYQSVVEPHIFELTGAEETPIEVRCVYVPASDNSVNCHHMGPYGRIVAVTLFAGGPPLSFAGGKPAIELIFDDASSEQRIIGAIEETAAYLFDAARP